MNVSVRPATRADAPALAQWYEEDLLGRAEHRAKKLPPEAHPDRVAAIMANPDRRLLILSVASVRIGAALLTRDGGGWRQNVFLKPAYLGKGDDARAALGRWIDGEPS